jgi:uroporphyrinogen-III decarboxylase
VTATERFFAALSGSMPDRVPSLPKIWLDLGAGLTGTGLREVIEDPFLAMEVIIKAGLAVRADGARLFHFPGRKTAVREDTFVEIDNKGNMLGKIDMQGGWATLLTDVKKINLEDPYQMAFVQFYHTSEPLVRTVDDAKRIAVPGKSLYRQLGFADLQKRLLQEYSEKIALLGDCASATLAFCVLYRKLENALLDFIENPGLVHALMEKGVAFAVEKGKFNIDTGIKMLRLNDSIANMSVISPDNFREFVFPHMKTVCDELHRYDPDVKIYCHICGNTLPVMDDLVAAGIDCIGPLDPLGGFTTAQARKAVGDRVALMGGVNTLSFIDSTPDQIIDESRICIEMAGKKGYILGSGCAVPRQARKENLAALRLAAERFGTTTLDSH